MKCPHCEYERDTAFAFCPKCGKPSTRTDSPAPACPTPRILNFIKDDLFLISCITLTAAMGCLMLSGGFNVMHLLITIFAWLTYAGGYKNVVEHRYIKVISGSVYAIYIITNVIAVITTICGIIYTVMVFAAPALSGLNPEEFFTQEVGPLVMLSGAVLALISAFAAVIGIILIVVSIIILTVNVMGCGAIHNFIKSLYKSAENGEEKIAAVAKAKVWFVIFAAFFIISSVSSISAGRIFGFLYALFFAASLILFALLTGKHLK